VQCPSRAGAFGAYRCMVTPSSLSAGGGNQFDSFFAPGDVLILHVVYIKAVMHPSVLYLRSSLGITSQWQSDQLGWPPGSLQHHIL
jgi:hypothetical protein